MSSPTCIIFLNSAHQILRIVDDAEVLVEKNFPWTTAATLTSHIKNVVQKYPTVKEAYCIIDDEACYYRLVDGQKSKDELRALWNVPEEHWFGYFERKNSQWRNIYYGLSYPQSLILGYAAAIKKAGLVCAGIIPADFVFHFSATPGIYQEQLAQKQRVKIFDQEGAYYSTILYGGVEEQRTENLLSYVERERLVDLTGLSLHPNFSDLPNLERLQTFLQPSMIVYAQNSRNYVPKPKAKMNLKQKTAWAFLAAIIFLIGMLFAREAFIAYTIQRDINEYNNQYNLVADQVKQLHDVEKKTRYLKAKTVASNPPLKKLLDLLQGHKLMLKELSFDQRRKQVSLSAYDPEEYRNNFIKDLQNNVLFASVTLIYLVPAGPRTEFKVVVLLR